NDSGNRRAGSRVCPVIFAESDARYWILDAGWCRCYWTLRFECWSVGMPIIAVSDVRCPAVPVILDATVGMLECWNADHCCE
ncbi:MAG: hypothetical protein QGF00_22445, partial [Planctomycetota bacterium]|nr:hypothetical protein [Planctomycetota bacterium]